ncbi:hypothetical protein LAZ67_14002349 [Cordylochernes scorpioides]|uniref:Uncharacterized protein n=1 Tax=Cordylochernes scorpioides TaxID=51811 RepID=A0ABY6LBS7_9ARAC|nr:hypothetical protein LAZ67_14002349 [Cordylochernes scorpioides]
MRTSAYGWRNVANSSIGPLVSDGSASSSHKRICSPSSRRTTTKTTGAGPLRHPACRPSSNTAKIRSRLRYGPGFAPMARPSSFSWIRGQNQPRNVSQKHSRSRRTPVGSTALRRCGLEVPAGLRTGSQGEMYSQLMQGPFSKLRHVGGMTALLSRYHPDGLQRMVHFADQGLCYTPQRFEVAEAIAGLSSEDLWSCVSPPREANLKPDDSPSLDRPRAKVGVGGDDGASCYILFWRSRHAKKILQAASCRRNDVEENPTSRVTWTERRRRKSHEQSFVDGKGRIGVSLKQRLEDGKRHLDNQRVVTIRQPTRDNWTSRQEKAKTVLPRAGRDRFKGNMEEMDAIKKRRKAIRGTFTRIINEINGEFEKSQIDRNDIYSKFNRPESYYTKLVDLNEKYQALLVVKEGITEESIDKEWQECDKYEEEKFDIQQKVSVLRNPDKEETIPIASEDTVINVKLPELALKSYDGSLEGWLPWWAQFSKIHENKNLSDSDRFLYLRQAIVPNSEAYRVVASYPVTGANYVLAVQALQERFGDPNILTELYVRRLLNSVISNVKRENRNLSSLYDELSSHLRSLETLGIDPQLSGIFLYPLVESSLPSDILKIWHRHPSSGYGMELAKREESDKGVGGAQERLRLLLDFLKAEVRSAQRLKFVEKGFKQEEPYKRSYNDGTRTRSNFRPATVSSLFGGRTNIKCFFCERTNHASHQCRSIMKMSPGERNDKIRSAHLCFKCLRKGHIQSQCREQLECKNCGRNHLEVLCEGNSSNRLAKPGRENLKENATEPIASLSSQACTGQVLLMTTVALLRGPNASRRVRILLDSGSQFSYIKQSLVWSIGIERKGEITIAKSIFGGNKIGEEKHGKFMLELENLGNKRDVIHIEALDQRKICDAIPPLPKGDWLEKLKIKGIILSQDNFKGQEIDILIGANYLGMILTGKIVQVEADLTAVETKLGWTLMGNSPIIDSSDNVQQTLNLLTTRCDLKDLWDLEVLGIRDPVETCSKETRYQEIKEKFITKIQRQSDQRYSVGLPWKVEKESIPSNLDIAIKRLDISTKKMTSQNKLTEYSQIFRDWLTEGLIERVEENPLERRGYYLPHRPVYKMESKTTPIRPVFDASCLGHNGLSLNQCLEKGPNLLERIPEMIIRFRENKFGVTADIRKAFQMVAIEESERNYLRFLWWEKESDRELIAYRHKRLVFGLNCSPFVLNAVIEYHLQSIRGPLVQWAKILAQSFYMDNCITSLETKQEVQEFQKAAIEIMDRAKMDLREWEYSLEENPEKGTCTKILGVVWNKMEDSLKCELPDNLSLQPKLTKRLVLSMVQRIFDPLGFCAPVFLPPKLLLQRSWGLKLGWDTPLPEGMAQEFRTWLDQIRLIELIKIPRYMWNDLIFPTEVHIFCDASQIGYGAVAYLRSETGRENTLTLIWSKVRLAPMKSITIPRLELMAMVLGARLANAIQAALKRKCETTLWSDSTTALSWIKKEIEWRVFVRNRVREIQATTNLNDWRFVPSQLNPADLLSRGCPPSQFVQSRWWEGPEWLKKPKEFWPNSEFSINPKEIKEMLIKMLGHRKLKYVQLQTALCEIESIINNRPLTYVSEDDNDLKPLTPNEFLQNGPESSFPEFENLKPEMLHTRYRELGQLKRELKQRFLKEYLGALIQKSENIDRRQLKVGDVVLIGQENLKRMLWPKGRIVNLIPGKDGIVRVAHVKTSTGTLIRALQRLHPLEISSNVKTIQKDNSNTEPQSDAFLGNRPNIESRDSRNRYGRVIRKPARRSRHAKKILQAASCRRNDVEENPTSRVTWTERRRRKSHEQSFVDGKGRIGVSLKQRLEDGKRHLDNQRVVTIRQPTRDNWTSRQEKAKTVLPRGFHRLVEAKTSLQNEDFPIDDTTTKPLFTPQENVKRFNSNSSKAHQYQPFPRTAAATHHQQEPHKPINLPPYPCNICASHQLPTQIHFHRDCPHKNNNHPKRINPAFLSSKFKHFLERNNVKHLLTSAHHPETNAKVERLNSTIINRLRCDYNANLKIPWTKYIPKITESYNEIVHTNRLYS